MRRGKKKGGGGDDDAPAEQDQMSNPLAGGSSREMDFDSAPPSRTVSLGGANDFLGSAALAATSGDGTGEWATTPGAQSRLKDPSYCKRKVEAYDKRLRATGADKGEKSFNNGFEKMITSTSERKLYMGLEWSDDVYTTQNQLQLLGSATIKFRDWKQEAEDLKATSDLLFLTIALCGALVPPIIGVSSLFPKLKWLKTSCDVSILHQCIDRCAPPDACAGS
eukprot:COSAG01_NODE_3164_length_6477_cov_6.494983_6_plen_222_part_00